MTLDAYSLVLLLSAALSLLLALLTVAAGRWSNPTVRSFAAYSCATMLWALGHFLQQAAATGAEPGLSPIGSAGWVVSLVRATGMIGTPITWFVLCTRVERNGAFPRYLGPPLAALFAVSIALVATNPATGWILRTASGAAGVEVRWPEYVMLAAFAALSVSGAWRLMRRGWTRGRGRHVITATMVAAVALSVGGGVVWVSRAGRGMPVAGDLAPLLFPLINVILLYEVLRRGFADIIPIATARAFASMSDLALIVSPALVIEDLNDAARRELPAIRVGQRLEETLPELAERARACVDGVCGPCSFDVRVDDNVYEGRVYPPKTPAASDGTSLIMLTDVTELRRAHDKLERAHAGSDADASSLRTPY